MLDKATLEWLEERKDPLYINRWKLPSSDPFIYNRFADFIEEAEFEARVALKIMGVTCGDLPCGADPDCPSKIMSMHNQLNGKGCDMCILRHARLEVEKEMIREGKGPGSPEDA